MMGLRRRFLIVLAAAFVLGAAPRGEAAQTIKAGKAVSEAWTFLPLDVGVRQGIFARYGLDVDIVNFTGDAKLQQGLASQSIAFGLGSGPGMAFAVKGSPAIAVAAYFEAPRNISIVVGAHSPIRTEADLKGRTLAISTAGSLTAWLVERVSLAQGWGRDGIGAAALGGFTPGYAAMKAHQVDGLMGSTEAGYLLEEKEAGRILVSMDKYAPLFITHVVFARTDLVDKDPDLVTRFLKGFFASIAYIRTHKAETGKIAEDVLHLSPTVADEAYDHELPMMEEDGRFDAKAVAVLKRSFVEMGILAAEPRDDQLFTTRFVPVKP